MTWSLAYSQSFTTASSLASGLGPWEYHFETWLPTKGWTISEDEDGGIGSGPYGSTQSKFYGVEKTFTNAAGNTYDFKYIVELNFGFRYVIYYPWTGVAGEGADSAVNFVQTNNYSLGETTTKTWRWLESDENTDSHMLLMGSNGFGCFSFPTSQVFVDLDESTIPALTCSNATHFWMGGTATTMYAALGGSSILKAAFILTPNFSLSKASNSSTLALNDQQDTLLKINGTSSSTYNFSAVSPASLQIGSKYYLDLYPSSTRSLLLDTGLVDLGVFT